VRCSCNALKVRSHQMCCTALQCGALWHCTAPWGVAQHRNNASGVNEPLDQLRYSEASTQYCKFYTVQILTHTFKIATSFFNTASSLCGKRSLSMTFIATSLFVDMCKPSRTMEQQWNKHRLRNASMWFSSTLRHDAI